jgi:WD40 repeat protein
MDKHMSGRWQTVRVFISSTFRDMHAERDYLVRVVFPGLREKLERYRIHLVDIDLRWGATPEQVKNERVVSFCLQEVDECRPFFIGMLGERYGYPLKAFSKEAISRFEWLQRETGKSITELEVLFGALQVPRDGQGAMFFFRNPSFKLDVPLCKRKDVESEDEESVKKLEQLKAAIRDAQLPVENYPCRYRGLKLNWRSVRRELSEKDCRRLADYARDDLIDPNEYECLEPDLREFVNKHGVVYLDGLEEFGRSVQERLWEAIRTRLQLPEKAPIMALGETDPLAQEADYHERFMETRLRVYAGRGRVIKELTQYVEGDEAKPCLLAAASGAGKSSALAKFVQVYRQSHRDSLVIPHFVGASPGSSDLGHMLRRLCLTLRKECESYRVEKGNVSNPREDEENRQIIEPGRGFRQGARVLARWLPRWMARAARERKLLVIIDALDQLDESENAHSLSWLPWKLPRNVKLVTSCIKSESGNVDAPTATPENRILEAFTERAHVPITLEPLTHPERREIMREVPSISAKTLSEEQIQALLEIPGTGNPLFLQVALEELRGFGSYKQLGARIASFPRDADALGAIFNQVMDRFEEDFGQRLADLVLGGLACARRGLSEREIQELVTLDNESNAGPRRANPAECFTMLRQLRPYLLYRGELLDFYHRNLLEAIRKRYLDTEEKKRATHGRLAHYFDRQNYFDGPAKKQGAQPERNPRRRRTVNVRKADELPWHRLRAEQWAEVGELFTDTHFLEAKAESGMLSDLMMEFTTVIRSLPADIPQRRILSLLAKALRLNSQFIARHFEDYPQALFQSLWNSCWWFDQPGAAKHYGGAAMWKKLHGGLRELRMWRGLSRSRNGELCQFMENWRAVKEKDSPGFLWIRSLRPPAVRLGSALIRVLAGHENTVTSVACSPDGLRIASGSADKTIRIWDSVIGKEIVILRGHGDGVRAIDFSADGRRILSCSSDRTVRVWDAASGRQLNALEMREGDFVRRAGFSPDGRQIVGGISELVCIWDTASGRQLRVMRGHEAEVITASFSSDGRRIVSGSSDGTLRIWDVESGQQSAELNGHFRPITSAKFSPDCRHVVTCSAGEQAVSSATHAANVSGRALGVVAILILQGLQHLMDRKEMTGREFLAKGEWDPLPVWHKSTDNTIRIWDAQSGRQLTALSGHKAAVCSVDYSPDGRRIVSGSVDKTLRVWDARTFVQLATVRGHEEGVTSVAYSPDGYSIISGSKDGTLRVWDAESIQGKTSKATGHTDEIADLCYTPDGSVITSSNDRTVRLWHPGDAEILVLRRHADTVTSVSCSRDGRRICSASRDKTVRIWDSRSGKQVAVLRHTSDVEIAKFLDERFVVSGSSDHKVYIWDFKSGKQVGCLRGHRAKDLKNCLMEIGDSRYGPDAIRIPQGEAVFIYRASSGKCLDVVENQAATHKNSPGVEARWRAVKREFETAILDVATGEEIAWFPTMLRDIAAHVSGCAWAGHDGSHAYIIQVEATR